LDFRFIFRHTAGVNKTKNPTRSKLPALQQICNLIPAHLVPKLAKDLGVDKKARDFSIWSHVVALLHSQIAHSIGLNDVCDSLQLNRSALAAIRGATPPSRNGLSHANKVRDAALAENLFWAVLNSIKDLSPAFLKGSRRGRAHRFKVPIHIVDATVIELVANHLDWAKHRRRKAAAKTHMRLNLQSLLPQCVIIDTAKEHDNLRARELCAAIKEGEIVIFDKGYLDFDHLRDLDLRGVQWVTRAKENMNYCVVEALPVSGHAHMQSDEIIQLENQRQSAPEILRRVTALVEVDGERREMSFLTNNLHWSPNSVADLYRCRWEIEVFFKQIKQTLQIADFLGHNANAVRWQVWMALLAYVLLRYLSFLSKWDHSFTRLFTITRAALWRKIDLLELLRSYGTAGGHFRHLARPEQAYFAGFA
jgi:hypothetical protein